LLIVPELKAVWNYGGLKVRYSVVNEVYRGFDESFCILERHVAGQSELAIKGWRGLALGNCNRLSIILKSGGLGLGVPEL
jgi:hypothetical protein